MLWGLHDTVDETWIGVESGPLTFADKFLALAAAQVTDEQLGQPAGRTRAKRYRAMSVRLKETVPAKMSPLKALRYIEEGKET